MILTEYATIQVMNKSQYDYFTNIGYIIRYRDYITISVEKLPVYSGYKIDVKCDVCGNEKILKYSKYIKNINNGGYYACCEKCAVEKNKKTNLERYGVENPRPIDINKEKFIEKQKNHIVLKESIKIKLLIIGFKKCSICNENKELIDFSKCSRRIDGYLNQCKSCMNMIRTERYFKNRDIFLPIRRERKQKYVENNRKKVNENQRIYYNTIFKYTNQHMLVWRQILSTTIKRMNKKKEGHTIDLLCYSALELKNDIESKFTTGMSWENHGEWHIDHIKPVASFDKDTPVNIVCSLNNLQPLWSTTREIDGVIYEGNLNKGKKI